MTDMINRKISYEKYREKLFTLLEKNNYTFTRDQAFETLVLNPDKVSDNARFRNALYYFRNKVRNKKNDYIIDYILRTDRLIADRIPYVRYVSELKKYVFPIDDKNFHLFKDAIKRTGVGITKAFLRGLKRTLMFHPEIKTIEDLDDYIINLTGVKGSEVMISLTEIFGKEIFKDLLKMDYKTFDKEIKDLKF